MNQAAAATTGANRRRRGEVAGDAGRVKRRDDGDGDQDETEGRKDAANVKRRENDRDTELK